MKFTNFLNTNMTDVHEPETRLPVGQVRSYNMSQIRGVSPKTMIEIGRS